MAITIAAEPERVWRALVDPDEIVHWDPSRTALVDREVPYPTTGTRTRWRSRLGNVALALSETPHEVAPGEWIQSRCAAGSLRYEQSYRLVEEPGDRAQPTRTRVSLKLSAPNRLQLIGADIDRFEVRRLLVERIDEALRALQKRCES